MFDLFHDYRRFEYARLAREPGEPPLRHPAVQLTETARSRHTVSQPRRGSTRDTRHALRVAAVGRYAEVLVSWLRAEPD